MHVGIAVGHRIDCEGHVVPKVIGATGGGFDTNAGRDSREYDLGYIATTEIGIEIRDKKAPKRCLPMR